MQLKKWYHRSWMKLAFQYNKHRKKSVRGLKAGHILQKKLWKSMIICEKVWSSFIKSFSIFFPWKSPYFIVIYMVKVLLVHNYFCWKLVFINRPGDCNDILLIIKIHKMFHKLPETEIKFRLNLGCHSNKCSL